MGRQAGACRVAQRGGAQRRAVALETGIVKSPLAFAIILAAFPESEQVRLLWLPMLYALFVLMSASVATVVFRRSADDS